MESWEKFADALQLTKDLEEIYFKMRKVFQREGWTQKDIEKPPYYPQDLMFLHSELPPLIREIDKTIKDYGFDVDGTKVHYYVMDKLRHIDDITPLRNPNPNGD
jgi:hypothetical protein